MTAFADSPQSVDYDALRMAGTMLHLSRALEHGMRETDPGDGLTVTEVSTLGQVDRGQDLPSTVARALRLDPGRVTRITDRLVELGYLERVVDATDRRRCPLRLTESGRERLEIGRVQISGTMNALLDGLAQADRADLHRSLLAVRVLLDQSLPPR